MNSKQLGIALSIVSLMITLTGPSAMAQGKGNGGGNNGGSGDATHELVDLLGLPGEELQSHGQFLTDRGEIDGMILIAGNSHWYNGNPGSPPLISVMWQIDNGGNLSQGDPVNLGVPTTTREIKVMGMNHYGVVIGNTGWASEQDENGNWIFPSFVKTHGNSWQEIPFPTGASPNTHLDAINDAGQIIGSYKIPDPNNPPHSAVVYTAMWQVEIDGTISGPVIIDDSTDSPRFEVNDLNNFGVMAGHLDGWPAIGWLENGALQTVTLDSSLLFFGAEVEALNDFFYDDSRLTVVGTTRADENGDFAAPDRGYAWRPSDFTNQTTLIGTFGDENGDSWAFDVNDSGQIVGVADAKKGGPHPFLFADGEMKNLNSIVDSGKKTLQRANAINNQGDITGLMKFPRPVSEIHGYLLRAKDQ